MVSLKIQKRSVLVLILTLILFSGNTIIIGYVTPLLYLVGFFSFIWGDRKQIRSNKYTSRIIGIYLAWLIFLIINTVQSYDFSASKSMIPVFIMLPGSNNGYAILIKNILKQISFLNELKPAKLQKIWESDSVRAKKVRSK